MTTSSGEARFATTRWSVVARAGAAGEDPERGAALAELCESYWYPVYAFARRKGEEPDQAMDLVQSFFAGLIEREQFSRADPARGRFRSYLLTSFVNFMAKERDRAQALKRGGGRHVLSLDGELAENRLAELGSDSSDPERIYRRAWALTVVELIVERLGEEYVQRGKGDLFRALRPTLGGDRGAQSLGEVARELGTTEGAVKVAAHRLRQRFGSLLRREVVETVLESDDVEDEIQGLFEALA